MRRQTVAGDVRPGEAAAACPVAGRGGGGRGGGGYSAICEAEMAKIDANILSV